MKKNNQQKKHSTLVIAVILILMASFVALADYYWISTIIAYAELSLPLYALATVMALAALAIFIYQAYNSASSYNPTPEDHTASQGSFAPAASNDNPNAVQAVTNTNNHTSDLVDLDSSSTKNIKSQDQNRKNHQSHHSPAKDPRQATHPSILESVEDHHPLTYGNDLDTNAKITGENSKKPNKSNDIQNKDCEKGQKDVLYNQEVTTGLGSTDTNARSSNDEKEWVLVDPEVEVSKSEQMRNLVWYLMFLATQNNNQFVQGTFLLEDEDGFIMNHFQQKGNHIENIRQRLIKATGQSQETAECYQRASSHYPGVLSSSYGKEFEDHHHGLDIEDLPASKKTVVFASVTLNNKQCIYIKPEDAGCDITKPVEFLEHSRDYLAGRIRHLVIAIGLLSPPQHSLPHRKEHVPNAIQKGFDKIFGLNTDIDKNEGIAAMYAYAEAQNNDQKSSFLKLLRDNNITIKEDSILPKGNEVTFSRKQLLALVPNYDFNNSELGTNSQFRSYVQKHCNNIDLGKAIQWAQEGHKWVHEKLGKQALAVQKAERPLSSATLLAAPGNVAVGIPEEALHADTRAGRASRHNDFQQFLQHIA